MTAELLTEWEAYSSYWGVKQWKKREEVIVIPSLPLLHVTGIMWPDCTCARWILLSAAPGSQDELNIMRYIEVKSVCKEKQWEGLCFCSMNRIHVQRIWKVMRLSSQEQQQHLLLAQKCWLYMYIYTIYWLYSSDKTLSKSRIKTTYFFLCRPK